MLHRGESDREILDRESRGVEGRDIALGLAAFGRSGEHIAKLNDILSSQNACLDRMNEVAVVAGLLAARSQDTAV